MSEILENLVEEKEETDDPKSDEQNEEGPKEEKNNKFNQAKDLQIEESNPYSTDSEDDDEVNSLWKKGDEGVGSTKPVKPSVEDRALQAILAERRRSLEMAKGDGTKFIIQRSKPPLPKSEEDNVVKNRIMNTKVHLHLSRELRQKKRLLGFQGKKEIYTDKDRAAAVTLGDQDIKTSLKVKQKNERKIVVPEDMDANVYLTEAQKNLSTGNHKAALICACKAVNIGGPDPLNLLMRGRCFLLLGKLNEALEDAQNALEEDPSLVKALLVQAEALYTMGEFERALVLFHRGQRRRPDLLAFQKGINKAREAILNAIGGGKFPKAKVTTAPESTLKGKVGSSFETTIMLDDRWKSQGGPKRQSTIETSNMKELLRQKKMDTSGNFDKKKLAAGKIGAHDSSQKIDETQEKITPLITEIKTSKMASKRLLGGLSSDKEFLSKLLSRGDLSAPKFRVNVENSRQGRRKSSVVMETEEEPPGSDVVCAAKEAFTSLQYLEAFLWQRNPGNLSVEATRKHSITNRLKLKKKTSKISSTEKCFGSISEPKKTKKQTMTSNFTRKKRVFEKVSSIIQKLRQSESLGSMKHTLAEAENFVDELRLLVTKSENYAPCLVKLLTAIGKVLPRDNRGEDGIAVLRDASQIAKERELVEEYYQASDALGHVLATVGHKDEAVAIWESLNKCRQSVRKEKYENSETENINEEETSKQGKNINENNSEEVDSGVDARG